METLSLHQLKQKYQQLHNQYQAGQINQSKFYSDVYQLQAQDDDGCWWRVDPEKNVFIRHDGRQWVPASFPEHIEAKAEKKQDRSNLPQLVLRFRYSGADWVDFELTGDIIIGRSHDCDLILDDGAISRHHAKIILANDGVYVQDLNSSNGTKIDNRQLQPQVKEQVHEGQVIAVGGTTLTISSKGLPLEKQVFESPFLQKPPDKRSAAQAVSPSPVPQYSSVGGMSSQPQKAPLRSSGSKRGGNWLPVLMIGISLSICVCVVLAGGVFLLRNQQSQAMPTSIAIEVSDQETEIVEQKESEVPEAIPVVDTQVPTQAPTEIAEPEIYGNTWLVMFYNDADDINIEGALYLNANEAELAGSDENVDIVTQLDLYQGNFEIYPDDWSSTKRFYLTETNDWDYITSEEISDLGEQNMGDPETLVDFAIWAIETYPADRYALIMTDHGDGWMGGFYDEDPSPDLVGQLDVHIELVELSQALSYITQRTGIQKFDLIGLDACLMSTLEVYTAIAPYGKYAVASEEVEPFFGWAYTSFLSYLQSDPTMDGAELSRAIVRSYIEDDFMVVDEEVRQEVFGYGVTQNDVLYQYYPTITLSAVDLSVIPEVNQAFNQYIDILMTVDQSSVAWARTNAQHYQDIFMDEDDPLHSSSTIDLGNFAFLTADVTGNQELYSASEFLQAAIAKAVIEEKHGEERPFSQGITIYFPISEIYQLTYEQLPYTLIAEDFSNLSKWDEFLYFHYTQ